MTFPCLMYRTPGPHRKSSGVTYAYVGARDEAEYEAKLALGWYPSLDAALGHDGAEEVIEAADALADAVEDVDAPTREALEGEARALGIGFNSRTTDEALAARIAAKRADA